MMRRSWRRVAALSAVSLIGGLSPTILAATSLLPTAAAHAAASSLEVTQDIQSLDIGDTATLTATVNGTPSAPLVISFEIEGGPADTDGISRQTPDRQCAIGIASTSCTVTILSNVGGNSPVRAWMDLDAPTNGNLLNPTPTGSGGAVVEADPNEARYAGPTDCGADDDPINCPDPANFNAGTNTNEPDNTDVVEIDWTGAAVELGCVGTNNSKNIPAKANQVAGTAADVPVKCTVKDATGALLGGKRIDGENAGNAAGSTNNLGANDPDQGAQNNRSDYGNANGLVGPGGAGDKDFCVTSNDTASADFGTCTGTVPGSKGQLGPAYVCFWIDTNQEDAYAPAGAPNDGGNCDSNQVAQASFVPADLTDGVLITWQEPAPTTLLVTPGQQSQTAGGNASFTATVFDQFGGAMPNQLVRGEYFAASKSDADGNTPNSPDFNLCTTGASAPMNCTASRTQANPGNDGICFWSGTGTAPNMSGDATNPTCTAADATSPVAIAKVAWTPPPPPPGSNSGYWVVGADGSVYAFGKAQNFGGLGGVALPAPIVGMAASKSHKGYYLVGSDGSVYAFGDAVPHGSMRGRPLNKPIVGMAATPDGNGYWLIASDGGLFAFNAPFQGSMGGRPLNQPIVGIASTPDGQGYWEVAADGGIFAFNAPFLGSMGGKPLNKPVVGMTGQVDPNGPAYYRMVASDGGIFSFNAPFYGSLGSTKINQPIDGMSSVPSGQGYRLVAADGGVFNYGPDAPFLGSAADFHPAHIAAMDGF